MPNEKHERAKEWTQYGREETIIRETNASSTWVETIREERGEERIDERRRTVDADVILHT